MEEDLIKIGLSDKQAKVYLALLSLGKSSVQAISEQAGVKRATTYVILDELMSMGLVSTYEQLKKTFFVPESPERLAVLAQSQSAEIDRQITELKSIAPQLNKMRQKVGDGAKVEFFEGKESLKKAIKQVLQAQAHSTVRMFYNNDKISQHFSDTEREQIRDARQKKKIKTKIIYTSTSRELPAQTRSDTRIKVAGEKYPTDCDITLYNDKVQFASFGEEKPKGIIITDDAVHQAFESLFKLAWLGAKQVTSNK